MTIEIGVLIGIGALLISFLTYLYNKRKELKTDMRKASK
ncbi:uncharacterized membrane protein (DUF485 family) [Peribacillus huizhouensis]|uniref:Uncharacterized membrane protein (DUF485 family) n=1 Tax=Peribacillus huizhouensis TaxID=1501239 RepID=A0ABR6CIB6_9BACI|nr:uncharacterized membrane protein (DUF485 family) [Peribacillus huizhouensis]